MPSTIRGPLAILSALVRVVDNADSLDSVRNGLIMVIARKTLAHLRASESTELEWTPFEKVEPAPVTAAQIAMVRKHMPEWSEADALAYFDAEMASSTLYANSIYQVAVRDLPKDPHTRRLTHLSIKRIDQQPVHDWRDLQRIKDELIGPQCEAIELYPADSRLVDSANQYHLWASRDPTHRFPIGFTQRLVADSDDGPAAQRDLGPLDGNR